MIEHNWIRHPKVALSSCGACGRHWWHERPKPVDPCTRQREPVPAADSCPHLSWTGVEAGTDLDDPAKVWRCDGCGQTRTGAQQAAVDGPPIRVVEP